MSKIHQLPDIAGAEKEASAWIARLYADDVAPQDLARFAAWRSAHPRHAQAFAALSGTMGEVERAARIVRAVAFGNAMNTAALGPARAPARRSGARWGLLAAAAALATVALIAFVADHIGPQTLFQTAIGEHAAVELPDGSKLALNSNSAARVEYSQHARIIRLARGEAFFEVAHEPQRPFWVIAGSSWIRAVGTAFNVDLRPSGVRILVSEGTVKLVHARAPQETPSDAALAQEPVSMLTAGQHAQLEAGAARIRAAQPRELIRLAAWRKGKLYFENESLESVIEELGRYTATPIRIEDPSLKDLPIGGTFHANPQGVAALLQMLEQGFGLQVGTDEGGKVSIASAAPR